MDALAVNSRENQGGVLDRIEVRNQRDRHPVVPVNALVTGENCAQFAGLAAAQLDRSFGADAFKINGIMPRRVYGAKKAIRLLHQQGRLRPARRRRENQNR